ncbi:MAG: recombinase family protein [Candidatus Improbicoccus devescovinae]|nr:MAG: recombinase family protein [Candidatus Improbicoccus devescovinae]
MLNNNLQKITALYARLSKEDILDGESNSIANQKAFLVDYAQKLKFRNIEIFVDDGVSGVTFERAGFNKMHELIKNNRVGILIIKDMSRLGRNYLEVGHLVEHVFPMLNIRFIAVNDGIDSAKGENDFTPFRNIMNEWYAKDISKKIRCSHKIISKQGFAIGQPPYGYKRSFENPKIWVIDEEAVNNVRLIYQMRLEGRSCNKISEFLSSNKFLIPSQYALEKGIKRPQKNARNKYFWGPNLILKILKNRSYTGDVVNFKTYTKFFKLKKSLYNPKENWEIHKNIYEVIIERSMWEDVQKTLGIKQRAPKSVEKNMFSGILKCADCGANLNYNFRIKNQDYFICMNHKVKNGLCNKPHRIMVKKLTDFVKDYINEILVFAKNFENEFLQLIIGEKQRDAQKNKKRNRDKLQKLKNRYDELDSLFEKIYEDKVFGRLSEDKFLKLSVKFEDEQVLLKDEIKDLETIISKETSESNNVNEFLKKIKKYFVIEEVTREILNKLIDKIRIWHFEIIDGIKEQKIEIHFKLIGHIKIPEKIKNKLAANY